MTGQLSLFGADPPAPVAPPATPTATGRSAPAAQGREAAPVPDALQALAARLPAALHLGTSSWSFPGWAGILYAGAASEVTLSRHGLTAYGRHPLLRTVSIDRTFYAPLSAEQFAAYAQQVPAHFRFMVKAPAFITDFYRRGERGKPEGENPLFLDAERARRECIEPCMAGLREKAGPLVFQLSPLGRAAAREVPRIIERLHDFLAALQAHAPGPLYAVEPRDPEFLTPALIDVLTVNRARLCLGVHARMPPAAQQAALLATLPPGAVIARWNLHAGYAYADAKAHYAPFDRMVDEDLPTRAALADLAAHALNGGQPVFISVNNKAEGSAPLSCFALARAIADRLPA
ncbi:MAG: DUF72 domain-containing protein [Burkholderiales bacterium]